MDYHDQRKDRSTGQTFTRYPSSSDDEEKIAARNELRQKSREFHNLLKNRGYGKRNGDLGEVIPFASNSNIDTIVPSNSQLETHSVHLNNHTETTTEANTVSSADVSRGKDVILTSDCTRLSGNESDGVELCQKLFGIVIFQYSNGKAGWSNLPIQRRLVVQGLVEGSRGQSCGRIQRGDMLIRINNQEVTWFNFFRVLSSVRKRERVKLSFQSPRVVGPKSSCQVLQVPESDLCQALLGKRLDQIIVQLSKHPCLLLYLTFSTNNESEVDLKEDIIYAFPGDEERLTSLRGLFITLKATIGDVIGQPISSSLIMLQDSPVSIAYFPCGRDVLVLTVPQPCISSFRLTHVLDALHSLLVLLYGDAKSAFVNANRLWLDKLVAIMLHNALGLEPFTSSFSDSPSSSHQSSPPDDSYAMFCHRIPSASMGRYWSVKDLPLSHENKLICDEILTEFESMEFDDHLEREELFSRRKYTILGCSLYFKEYLLRSHLPSHQQKNINLFLNCHGLLSLSTRQCVDQVFVWQDLKYGDGDADNTLPGYTLPQARHFIMVVGMDHYLLGVWIEARGIPQSQCQMPSQPLLVEQGKATLAQLETPEVHMARCCQERLSGHEECIQLASADKLCSQSVLPPPRLRLYSNEMLTRKTARTPIKHSLVGAKSQDGMWKSRSKSVERLGDLDDYPSSPTDANSIVMKRQGSKISFESNDSAGSGSSTGHTKGRGSSIGDSSSISRSVSVLHILDPFQSNKSVRICRGRESAVLFFVTFDLQEGLLICPMNSELGSVLSPLQQDVLYNFHVSCQRMAQNFSCKSDNMSKAKDDKHCSGMSGNATNEASQEVSEFSREKEPVLEQGVSFTCSITAPTVDRKAGNLNLSYWVLGRRRTSPAANEMYVCFHESTHQEMVEMAFSLGFGS